MIRNLTEHDHLPDYRVEFQDADDMVVFRNRETMQTAQASALPGVQLDPDTYHEARQAAPGWDVHYLEQEWRAWMTEAPKNPDAAFLGFCRKWQTRRGSPR